jgi:arsenite methyltransferase
MTEGAVQGNHIGAAKPDYGIDAPGLVRFFAIGAAVMSALVLVGFTFIPDRNFWISIALGLGLTAAFYLAGMALLMVFWSKVAKIRGRDQVLGRIAWRGDEQVLDVGCGRGLMMIGAAKRLTTGKASGIDIWQARDQSDNLPDGAMINAQIEGVTDRIAVETADMRALPFTANHFDVVMSHWVVHNLPSQVDRNLTLAEMVRVLKPSGTLILCDIEYRDAYERELERLGLTGIDTTFSPLQDMILGAVSFGSFRPTTIIAQKRLHT